MTELAETKAKGSGDAEALGRAKQQLAELSEDLEAANRELEVCHKSPAPIPHVAAFMCI